MRMFDLVRRTNQGTSSTNRVRSRRSPSQPRGLLSALVTGLLAVATLLAAMAAPARADAPARNGARSLPMQTQPIPMLVERSVTTSGPASDVLSPAEIARVTPFVRGGSSGYRLSALADHALPASLVMRAERLIAAAGRERIVATRALASKPAVVARAGWTAHWWGIQIWMDAGVTKKVAEALITGGSAFLILGLLWDAGLVTAPIGVLLKVIGALAKAGGYLLRWCSGPRGAVVTRSWLAGMWCVAR